LDQSRTTVCDYLWLLHTHCKLGQFFDSLAEAQIKVLLREQVRSAIVERNVLRSHSHPRLELLSTIVSWGSMVRRWSEARGLGAIGRGIR